jgi:hypothetical protein
MIPRLRAIGGQSAHAPVPGQEPAATSVDPPSEQMTDGSALARCFDKTRLAAYLGISVRTWDRATAAGETPPPDLLVGGRSARWSPETIGRWLKTRPRLPGRGGRT